MSVSAARGVTIVMNRCEEAKTTGYLDLSECMLMYVADAIYMVIKDYEINRCSLKNNNLKKFPAKMTKKFPSMTVMNVEGNKLEDLPTDISAWQKSLVAINLSKNQFNNFPEALYELKSLTLLDLSHNNIQEIDMSRIFEELPCLKQINLAFNPCSQTLKSSINNYKTKHTECLIKLD